MGPSPVRMEGLAVLRQIVERRSRNSTSPCNSFASNRLPGAAGQVTPGPAGVVWGRRGAIPFIDWDISSPPTSSSMKRAILLNLAATACLFAAPSVWAQGAPASPGGFAAITGVIVDSLHDAAGLAHANVFIEGTTRSGF